MALLLTAFQAAQFGQEIIMAARMAQPSNCLVNVSEKDLQAFPMSDEFQAVIEIAGPNDTDFANFINLAPPNEDGKV